MLSTSGNIVVSTDRARIGGLFDPKVLLLIPFLIRFAELDPAQLDRLIELAEHPVFFSS